MGLLDDVGKLAGLAGLTGGGATKDPSLLPGLLQMLTSGESGGGLNSILQGLRQAGLGDAVSSWVSTGQNMPISPEQLQQGLGPDRVRQLAQSAGLSEGAAASALAALLPTVIDRLTPDGNVPQPGQMQQIASMLKGVLGG